MSLKRSLQLIPIIISFIALLISGFNYYSYWSLQKENNAMTGNMLVSTIASNGLDRFDKFIEYQNEVCFNDSNTNLQTNKELYLKAQDSYFRGDYNSTINEMGRVNTNIPCILTGRTIYETEKKKMSYFGLCVIVMIILFIVLITLINKKRKVK